MMVFLMVTMVRLTMVVVVMMVTLGTMVAPCDVTELMMVVRSRYASINGPVQAKVLDVEILAAGLSSRVGIGLSDGYIGFRCRDADFDFLLGKYARVPVSRETSSCGAVSKLTAPGRLSGWTL